MPSCLAVSSANQISGWIYTVVPWKSAFVPLVSPFIFVARHSYRIRQSMCENRLVDIFVFMSATTLCSFFFCRISYSSFSSHPSMGSRKYTFPFCWRSLWWVDFRTVHVPRHWMEMKRTMDIAALNRKSSEWKLSEHWIISVKQSIEVATKLNREIRWSIAINQLKPRDKWK